MGEEGSEGRGREERVASGGVLSTDPGFTCAVRSGEEPTDEIGMREGNILDWAGGKRCRVTKFLPPKLLNEIKIALFLKRNGTT